MASLWDVMTKSPAERRAKYAKQAAAKPAKVARKSRDTVGKVKAGGKAKKRSLGHAMSGSRRANRIDSYVSRAARGR